MANYDALKATIAARIHDNTEQEITAEDVRGSFNDVLDAVNSTKQDVIADLATIRSGASAGATAYQKPSGGIPGSDLDNGVRSDLNKARSAVQPADLALVASTGDYDDLIDKPSLATVATSGSYDDLTNKPTIPDAQVQSDWDEANSSEPSYIRNKPTIPAGVTVDQTYDATSTNAQSGVAVAEALAPVEEVIPSAATSSNQLADKAFVNSSLATNTANYISDNGEPFTSLADLEAYSGTLTNNDYAFVVGTDAAGNTTYTRYKYNASTDTWAEEYVLNNSSFTATQWDAINSGITSGDVALIASAVQPGDLAAVATSGSYADLLNKPTIPAAQVNSDWNAGSGVAQILNKPSLAAVATSGQYSDLTGTPTIPTVPTISTDIPTDKASNSKTTGAKAVYDFVKPATGSSIPAGGLLPGVKYRLGTLSGSVTMALAAASDASVENEYKGEFTAASTPPNITWQGVTQWAGNCLDSDTGLPLLTGGKHYEFNIENGYGLIVEFGV